MPILADIWHLFKNVSLKVFPEIKESVVTV
jgi:hypothetical protein